jgi:hypothetical protein
MQLTAQQQQFALTALDSVASTNEQATAATFFFRSLRQHFRDGYAFLAELEGSNKRSKEQRKHADVLMPFGKHKGRKPAEIDPSYLLWVLDISRSLRWASEGYLQEIQQTN